jgi:hypothetical protein
MTATNTVTRLVYDVMWVTGHDDLWEPATHRRVTALALGTALLAELVGSKHLRIATDREGDHLVMVNRAAVMPPADERPARGPPAGWCESRRRTPQARPR